MVSKTVSKKEAKTHARTSSAVSGKFISPHSIAERRRKHVVINQPRLKKAQELLGAKTESEAIEKALDRVIDDAERDENVWAAHDEFVKNMIDRNLEIEDVFGRLER